MSESGPLAIFQLEDRVVVPSTVASSRREALNACKLKAHSQAPSGRLDGATTAQAPRTWASVIKQCIACKEETPSLWFQGSSLMKSINGNETIGQ
jgi:hypothetical protein